MEKKNYPRITVIIRGYTIEQADLIVSSMITVEARFAVEVTLNTDNAFNIIRHLATTYGKKIAIGAGTVRSLKDAEQAVEHGAQFLLGPHNFSKEMFEFCQKSMVVSVPAAMTPTEINKMFEMGADIVKVFPARVVTPKFFEDIQAPLGKLPLMAVGGVSAQNISEFFNNGASYVGVGAGMFNRSDIEYLNSEGIQASLKKYKELMTK